MERADLCGVVFVAAWLLKTSTFWYNGPHFCFISLVILHPQLIMYLQLKTVFFSTYEILMINKCGSKANNLLSFCGSIMKSLLLKIKKYFTKV
jgi:hypothetical protein